MNLLSRGSSSTGLCRDDNEWGYSNNCLDMARVAALYKEV